MTRLICISACLMIPMALIGCAGRQSSSAAGPQTEPLGLQMVRTEAQLAKYPFRTLLEFEAATDVVFVRGGDGVLKLAGRMAHTGTSSLALERGTKSLLVRLPSLFPGGGFPGRWTLAGAYFYANSPQRLKATYEVDGAALAGVTVQIPANQWTPVLVDVASATDSRGEVAPPTIGQLRFTFADGLSRSIWCDDVIVLDNTQVLVDAVSGSEGWTVRERGFVYTLERAGVFKTSLPTPAGSARGWTLEEANEIRARFSSRGPVKSRVIYFDGRDIVDGKISGLAAYADPAVAQHGSPARIIIAADMGRLDRNSPGDANNDGYAEQLGTYQVIAAGARMDLTITPQPRSVTRPVLEIAKLPVGKVLVTMEGKLIESVVRLENGKVLVAIPGTLNRPTMVNVKVQ